MLSDLSDLVLVGWAERRGNRTQNRGHGLKETSGPWQRWHRREAGAVTGVTPSVCAATDGLGRRVARTVKGRQAE